MIDRFRMRRLASHQNVETKLVSKYLSEEIMKESKLIKGIVATVAIAAFSLPAIASADAGAELKGRTEKVAYADLNVDKRDGAQQLYRRLQQASKRVCGVESLKKMGTVRGMSEARRCYRDSLDSAVAKIDSAVLTEIHEG